MKINDLQYLENVATEEQVLGGLFIYNTHAEIEQFASSIASANSGSGVATGFAHAMSIAINSTPNNLFGNPNVVYNNTFSIFSGAKASSSSSSGRLYN